MFAALPDGSVATVGFADQAHLTRAARDFAGPTPGSLRPSVNRLVARHGTT